MSSYTSDDGIEYVEVSPGRYFNRAFLSRVGYTMPASTFLKLRTRRLLESKAYYYKEFPLQVISSWSDDKLKEYLRVKFSR